MPKSILVYLVIIMAILLSACSEGSNFRSQDKFECFTKAIYKSYLEVDIILHDIVDYELDETNLPFGYFPAFNIDVKMGKKWGFVAVWKTSLSFGNEKIETHSTQMPGSGNSFGEVFRARSNSKRLPTAISLSKSTNGKWYGTLFQTEKENSGSYLNSTHDVECEEQ